MTGSLKITHLKYLKPEAVQSQQTHSQQHKQFVYIHTYIHTYLDKRVSVTTAWCVLGLRMEERPPVRRLAANILNKESRTTDKRWSSSLGVGEVLTTPHRKNV